MIAIMRIRLLPALVALTLSSAAFGQRDPRPGIQSNLPPPQPPPEIARPGEIVKPAAELPKPVGKQCIVERTAPCTQDPAKECKVMEIADCK
jgi:hypothetical protein